GGKNTNIFSNTPIADTTDVDADPAFVDNTRGLAAWDASLGGPGTIDHALAGLAAVNQTPGTRYTTANLLAFVRAGYQPTNPALRNAGHDRADIGAMPVFNAPVIPTQKTNASSAGSSSLLLKPSTNAATSATSK